MNANLKHILSSKTNLALVCIAAMLAGFVGGAPALLSMAMIAFGLVGLWGIHPKKWLQQNWWLLGLAWIALYALSWFWSENTNFWAVLLQIKLPFLLLPLSFSFLPPFSARQQRIFTLLLFACLFGGMCYSLFAFSKDAESYISSYNYAKLLPAPADGDHIRFSMLLALSVCWGFYAWRLMLKKWMRWLLGFSILAVFIYLHFLAAKTGLLMLYVFLICYSCYLLFQKKQRWKGALLLAAFIGGVALAYALMPTFRARIGYTEYSFMQFQQGDRTGNYSDIGRIISYDISIKMISQFPMLGVGVGDLMSAMSMGYDRWYPQIPAAQRLIPHNQFLTIALGAGVPAAMFFLIWLLQPFTRLGKGRAAFYFIAGWLMLFVSLQTDAMLEVQYGVFVFLFFLCWFWHTLCLHGHDINKEKNPQ